MYSQILEVFRQYNVDNEVALASVLLQYPEEGGGDWEMHTIPPKELDGGLSFEFCRVLDKITRQPGSLFNDIGIQLYSLNRGQRVPEENVKKALFLSRTATLFTRHEFSYTNENFSTEHAEQYERRDWKINYDFIRDVYRYRKAIENDQLVILPQSIKLGSFYGGTQKKLLEDMNRTNIFNFGIDAQLLDAIIARYKNNHQLVSLPDLSVPWIRNLNLESVLQVKEDRGDSLEQFQRSYHQAILAYIENHKSLDFSRISRQINHDLVMPRLVEIEKDYKRIISLHKSLALTGAVVSLIPISGVIVSGALLNEMLISDIIKQFSSSVAGLLTTIATNKIQQKKAIQELEDDEFYILWKLQREYPTRYSS